MALGQHFFDTWSPGALSLLRFVAAYLYLQHGTAKLLHGLTLECSINCACCPATGLRECSKSSEAY